MTPQFYPLRVAAIRRETRDSVVVSFDVPIEHAEAFRFHQGQYLTLRTRVAGEEVRRAYSICSGVGEAQPRVGIKRVAGGTFSSFANEGLHVGDTVEVMAPAGQFHLPLDPAHRRHYLGFAAGSGITPLLSIIRSTLQAEPHSRFTLFYGNRASGSIMFRDELDELKSLHLARLSIVHILSREPQDVALFNGRLDGAKCDALLAHWVDPTRVDAAFICGPQDMMLGIAASLEAHGLPKDRIKFELFGSDGERTARRGRAHADAPADLCEATVVIDGLSRSFAMPKGSVALLDAAMQEGIELPYACKAGVCSTCRAKVVEGEVDMDANFALEDYEVARGYVLTCQSYPTTDRLTVDFDR